MEEKRQRFGDDTGYEKPRSRVINDPDVGSAIGCSVVAAVSSVLSATLGSNLENFRQRAWTASQRIGIVFGRWLETVTRENKRENYVENYGIFDQSRYSPSQDER
ncbi:hypothetical protein V1478_016042 [Vespula squamosa]|uniref:Uncharacterized protein n=1 Tax=Vespula squamosa TaxID=30214 RepID=A0ABD2A2K3_VESSQ